MYTYKTIKLFDKIRVDMPQDMIEKLRPPICVNGQGFHFCFVESIMDEVAVNIIYCSDVSFSDIENAFSFSSYYLEDMFDEYEIIESRKLNIEINGGFMIFKYSVDELGRMGLFFVYLLNNGIVQIVSSCAESVFPKYILMFLKIGESLSFMCEGELSHE